MCWRWGERTPAPLGAKPDPRQHWRREGPEQGLPGAPGEVDGTQGLPAPQDPWAQTCPAMKAPHCWEVAWHSPHGENQDGSTSNSGTPTPGKRLACTRAWEGQAQLWVGLKVPPFLRRLYCRNQTDPFLLRHLVG